MPKVPKTIERAYANLAATAPPEVELDWVSSHEVWFRDNPAGEDAPVELTVKDIWYPLNGRCPSRRAANMLKNWSKSKALALKFQNIVIGEHKKKINSAIPEGDKEVDLAPDLMAIKQMLREATK